MSEGAPDFAFATDCDADVAIVGGGPAGCSAGLFTARYGLDTVIFDLGRSSIKRCAHLGNYLGFPGGIDVETLYGLMHAHAEAAGCTLHSDRVEAVRRTDDGEGFVLERQRDDPTTAARVIAATRYDWEYLRPIGGDDITVTYERDGEEHEHLDTSVPDSDGRTHIEGLYVASPSDVDTQAILAAGRGGRTGLSVVEDARREAGYPQEAAAYYDWMRREAERDDDWRAQLRARIEARIPDGALGDAERAALVDREVERHGERYLDDAEIERRRERAHRRLLDHVDDETILERAREIDGADAIGD